MSGFPERIACLQPSATVTLDAIGARDRVVACTRYCRDVCSGIDDGSRLILHDSWTAQAAEIVGAKPDLVIASVPYQLEAVAEILKAGVRFLGLAPRSLADIYSDTLAIAAIVGRVSDGERVIAEMQAEIEAVRRRNSGREQLRVFCEEWGKPIIASQPWVKELVEAAGAEFIGIPGQQTSADAVREASPEAFLAAWCGAGDRVPLGKLVRERRWSEMPAVKSNRVFCIRDELLNTPAVTLIGGLRAIEWALRAEGEQPPGVRAMRSGAELDSVT